MRAFVSNAAVQAATAVIPMSVVWLIFVLPVLGAAGAAFGLLLWATALASVRATHTTVLLPAPAIQPRTLTRR